MSSLKGTQTEKNLLKAFTGESIARNKYTYWAGQAKKDGFEQIAAIFLETADQEKEHAKRLFKFLEGGDVEITVTLPAGVIGATLDNLKHAAEGEEYEWQQMYPSFAATAKAEGFAEVAAVMTCIAVAEKFHGERYRSFATAITDGTVFKCAAGKTVWLCRNCGYLHTGVTAPEKCPACAHPQAYFQRF
ncbi:MAG: rubrerythrin family protein [bacterium]